MVCVADIEWLAGAPAQQDDPHKVDEGHGEYQERNQDREFARVSRGMEVREYCEDGEKIAREVAAGVSEEGFCIWEVVWKEAEKCAACQESDGGNEVVHRKGGEEAEVEGGNEAQAGAEAIHVVHEVEGVNDGEDPKDRDGVAEKDVWDEERDPNAGAGEGEGDEELSHELWCGLEFVAVVEPAQEEHGEGADADGGELEGAFGEAVAQEGGGFVGLRGSGWEARRGVPNQEIDDGQEERQDKTGGHRQPAGERDGGGMDFAMAGIIDESGANGPAPPKRGGDEAGQKAGGGGRQVCVDWEIHLRASCK